MCMCVMSTCNSDRQIPSHQRVLADVGKRDTKLDWLLRMKSKTGWIINLLQPHSPRDVTTWVRKISSRIASHRRDQD